MSWWNRAVPDDCESQPVTVHNCATNMACYAALVATACDGEFMITTVQLLSCKQNAINYQSHLTPMRVCVP